MLKEAIILAGGMGTRLNSVLEGIPKPMALISGKPFLEYLLDYLELQNVTHVVLSVGYKHEIISKHFKHFYRTIAISYAIESKPIGTGGGIKKALNMIKSDNVFIINGDSFFKINFDALLDRHSCQNADLTIALKPMNNFKRYAIVDTTNKGKVIGFREKQFEVSGNINAGIYLIKTDLFERIKMPEKFSFEKDFMGEKISKLDMYSMTFDKYFIDIGIPEDYQRAQKELKKEMFLLKED
jgi:D-glycero-alpha-D-manno-heptose 1-phosphate guanylyltransferase